MPQLWTFDQGSGVKSPPRRDLEGAELCWAENSLFPVAIYSDNGGSWLGSMPATKC